MNYLHQCGGYAIGAVCLSVCQSVSQSFCVHDYSRTRVTGMGIRAPAGMSR